MMREEKLPFAAPMQPPARSARARSSVALSCASFCLTLLALIFLSYSSGISLPGQLVKSFESSKDVNPNVDDEDSKWVFVGPPSKYTYVDFPNQQHIAPIREQYESLVPLEAHIMSKCSDAKDCLRDMILPVMQRVHDKVNFTLSFIGTPTKNDGVACKHGPEECMGNILELCAFERYPDPKISLGFTMCIMRDYPQIPQRELIEECALEHAVGFKALNECAVEDNGAHGMEMLRESVQRTSDAGVTTSCTVRLNDEIYCVRDDGEWKDCPSGPSVDKLEASIESLYAAQNRP